jgi:capsular polysaccharide biosynthesis protein
LHDSQLNGRKRYATQGPYTSQGRTRGGLGTDAQAEQGERILSVKQPLRAIWKRLWMIVLVVIVLVGPVVGFDLLRTPTYVASSKLLVGQVEQPYSSNAGSLSGSLGGDVQGLQQITQTVAKAVNTRPVVEATIQQLGLQMDPGEIQGKLRAEKVEDTQFIDVSYTDTDPERAEQILNVLGEEFSKQSSEVSPGTVPITAKVWEKATLPQTPDSPHLWRDALLALMLGSALGIGLAFLLDNDELDEQRGSSSEEKKKAKLPSGVARTR